MTSTAQQVSKDVEFQLNVVKGFPVMNEVWRVDHSSIVSSTGRLVDAMFKTNTTAEAKAYKKEIDTLNAEATLLQSYILKNVSSNPKQWSKENLYELANHKMGFAVIDALNNLRLAAGKTLPGSKTYTPEAIEAQNALKAVMPESFDKSETMNLITFVNNIKEVAVATSERREELRKQDAKPPVYRKPSAQAGFGKAGAVFDLSPDIQASPLEDKKFNQQEELAMLEARGVKVDGKQTLETPTFEQAALKAVASLKGESAVRVA